MCFSASIYVAQNAPKMHASYLLFEVNWVALANTSASFQYYSFMSIKVIVMFNVSMKSKHSFFTSVVFIFANAFCLWATSHSRTSILFCVMPTCLCNSMCSNSTTCNVDHIVPNSPRIPLEGEHWWM